jgi:hypothetical protein
MAYKIQAGIQVSLNGSTWYKLTDHNREPIKIDVEMIESSSRMANGAMRKYVVAKKHKISTSWAFLPTKTAEAADGNFGGAWMESFYNANAGIPIYVKVIESKLNADPAVGAIPDESGANFKTAQTETSTTNATGSRTYSVFITSFSKTLSKRTPVADYVDISIEFTEI